MNSFAARAWARLPDETTIHIVSFVGGRSLCNAVACRSVSCGLRRTSCDAVASLLTTGEAAARREALGAVIKEAERGLPAALLGVLGRMSDADALVRLGAVSALQYLVRKEDIEAPLVVKAAALLLTDVNNEVRSCAWELLASSAGLGDTIALTAALPLLNGDCGEVLQKEALEQIGKLAPRGDVVAVAASLRCVDSADVEVQRVAVAALGDLAPRGHPEATACLVDCMQGPDPQVCLIAATVSAKVFQIGEQSGVEALAALCAHRSAFVSLRALMVLPAIAQPGDVVAMAALTQRLDDSNRDVAAAAARARRVLSFEAELGDGASEATLPQLGAVGSDGHETVVVDEQENTEEELEEAGTEADAEDDEEGACCMRLVSQ